MDSNNGIPDPMDVKAVSSHVDELLAEAAAYRFRYEKDWREYEKFYDKQQWRSADKKPVVNWVFTIIESEVPILTDGKSGTSVISIENERSDDAKVLEEAINYVYYCNHIELRLAQAIRSALVSTNSYLYVDFDPDKENGEGQVIIKNLPWRQVYLDPSEGDLDDMAYVLIKRPVKVDHLKRQFPQFAEEIEPEDIEDDDVDSEYNMYMQENRYHAPQSGLKTSGAFKPMDMAYLIEAWIKDYEMAPVPDEETMQAIQDELTSIDQGVQPQVARFMNHQMIMQAIQSKLADLGFHQAQQQADKQEAAAVGPQVIQEEVSQKIQSGAIQDVETAHAAADSLMGQLQQHVQTPTDTDVAISLLQDLYEQHVAAMKNNPDGMKPKYPGNLRLVVKTCDTILYDGPSPVENGMFPISPVYAYKLQGRPYSDGEVKNIIDCQKSFNELYWDEHQALRLNANSGWIIDDNSGIDETTLTNEQGIIVKKKAGTEARRLDPGTVSPQLANKQLENKSFIQLISGIQEVTQGIRPAGVDTYGATEALLQQTIGRIRLKSRMIDDYTMIRLGQLIASNIVKYWDKRKLLRVYDNDGRIQTLVFDPDRIYDLDYQVRMVPGSTVGISKESILAQSKDALVAGAIDAQTFFQINKNSIPFATEAIQKLQERDQLTQQAQALAQENDALKTQIAQLLGPPPKAPAIARQAPQPVQMQSAG